jgi:hypothetical protein
LKLRSSWAGGGKYELGFAEYGFGDFVFEAKYSLSLEKLLNKGKKWYYGGGSWSGAKIWGFLFGWKDIFRN